MKNIHEVIRAKEQEIMRIKTEVDALRIAAPLLNENEDRDEDDGSHWSGKAVGPQPISDKR
jgi:hypothetical protein